MRPGGVTLGLMSMPRVRSWSVVLAAAGAVALIIEGQVRSKSGLSAGDYALAVAAAVPLAWGTRGPRLANERRVRRVNARRRLDGAPPKSACVSPASFTTR